MIDKIPKIGIVRHTLDNFKYREFMRKIGVTIFICLKASYMFIFLLLIYYIIRYKQVTITTNSIIPYIFIILFCLDGIYINFEFAKQWWKEWKRY